MSMELKNGTKWNLKLEQKTPNIDFTNYYRCYLPPLEVNVACERR